MAGTLRITRQQLAKFLGNDHDAIRQFETLFSTVAESGSTAVATEPEIVVEVAGHEALARIERLERAFQMLELAPALVPAEPAPASTGSSGIVLGFAKATLTTYSSLTSSIPNDDTIPQITEGAQILSLSYTPVSATSQLMVDVEVFIRFAGTDTIIGGLFSGTTADAFAAGYLYSGSTMVIPFKFRGYIDSGSTSARTIQLRMGSVSGSGCKINGNASGRLMGGSLISLMTVTELSS